MSKKINYWEERGKLSFFYKGEEFYTITPIPYYYKRREILLSLIYEVFNNEKLKTICDFGCGDGWYLNHLSQKYPLKKYYGVDISNSMIERAKKNCKNVLFQVSNNGIQFDIEFDLIYSIAVFAHILKDEDIYDIFKNIYQKLNKGGYFVLFEQTGPQRMQGATWCRRRPLEYINIAEQSGFALEKNVLVTFSAHRLFERIVAPLFVKFFSNGANTYEKQINANKSIIFRALSLLMVMLSFSRLREGEVRTSGNTFFVFKKN